MEKKEIIYFNSELSLEKKEEQESSRLIGYAMKYNVLSSDRGGYRDVFRDGVFGDLVGKDIKAFRDHDESLYLGRTKNSTVQLWADEIGLKFTIDLPETTVGRDTLALIKRNDLSGMSFGVVVKQHRWKDEAKGPIREIYEADLHEISVVFNPAFPKTEVALASLNQWKEQKIEIEKEEETELKTPNLNRAKRVLQLFENKA